MAKRRPTKTTAQMEAALGFGLGSIRLPRDGEESFYSDLNRVPHDGHRLLKIEYAELTRTGQLHKEQPTGSTSHLPSVGETMTLEQDDTCLSITANTAVGNYRYVVDLEYKSGFVLPLLLSEAEVNRLLFVWKLRNVSERVGNPASTFLRLPRELRDRIYAFAVRPNQLIVGNFEAHQHGFTSGLGDPVGFYFPLWSGGRPILQLSRQVRHEALPFAFRQTVFELDDMDDAVRLLIAIGDTGRKNIESINIAWESRTDIEQRWQIDPKAEDIYLALPALHALRLVELLKLCRRLSHICLRFKSSKLEMPSKDFFSDPGIAGLCSLQNIRSPEVTDLAGHHLDEDHPLVKTLKERLVNSIGS